jgi:2-polyprenyl-3-methyl-5-hydroxy-6-metoxy-1,4-benzoquinol methylase
MCGSTDPRLIFTLHRKTKEYSLARCTQCGQHYCAPHPTAAEIAEFYSGDYHVELREKGATEREFGAKFRAYRDWLLEYVKGGRSLDIGTATGLFPSLLRDAGFDAEGIEFNEESAQWGRANYGVKITTGSLENSGILPGSYDLITMTDVLEHMDHPLRYLEFVRGYLKPGGFMLITFPDITSAESRYVHFLAGIFHREWLHHRCTSIPGHIWEFTPATARVMFQKAGFAVRGFRRRQDAFQPTSGIAALLLLPTRLLHMPPLDRLTGTQMHFVIQKQS